MCLSCKRTRNDSWSCCSAIGQKKTKVFWHQSEARTSRTLWNWSFKTLSPGALLRLLDFSSPEFFFARFDFFPPPLTAPGSPRMGSKHLLRQSLVYKCHIQIAPHCDYSLELLELKTNVQPPRGPGFWKFNCFLLEDCDYMKRWHVKFRNS